VELGRLLAKELLRAAESSAQGLVGGAEIQSAPQRQHSRTGVEIGEVYSPAIRTGWTRGKDKRAPVYPHTTFCRELSTATIAAAPAIGTRISFMNPFVGRIKTRFPKPFNKKSREGKIVCQQQKEPPGRGGTRNAARLSGPISKRPLCGTPKKRPKKVDLRKEVSRVEDQGQIGSCKANA